MNFVISDTHFGHTNIIKYCDRPFKDTDEMDREIIKNINSMVGENDILWHIGDFMFGFSTIPNDIRCIDYLSRIKCKNIMLILGNHDRVIKNSPYLRSKFTAVMPYFVGYFDGEPVTMNHKPLSGEGKAANMVAIETMNYQHKNCVNLFGHVHNNTHADDPHNMCVEVNDYKPRHIGGILK